MKTLLILGAGTGGTMVANKMSRYLDPREWKISVVDNDDNHYYQPGFLFIPFGIYKPSDVVKPKKNFLPNGVETIFAEIEHPAPLGAERAVGVRLGGVDGLAADGALGSHRRRVKRHRPPGKGGNRPPMVEIFPGGTGSRGYVCRPERRGLETWSTR